MRVSIPASQEKQKTAYLRAVFLLRLFNVDSDGLALQHLFV